MRPLALRHALLLPALLSMLGYSVTASAIPTITDVTSYVQLQSSQACAPDAQWASPFHGDLGTGNDLQLYSNVVGFGTSGNCCPTPSNIDEPGACFAQCVELVTRWYSHYVFAGQPIADTELWGNGGSEICQCALGNFNNCSSRTASHYKVYWPGSAPLPQPGDAISYNSVHAVIVTNTFSSGGKTYIGEISQNATYTNIEEWSNSQVADETCVIHPLANATPPVCGCYDGNQTSFYCGASISGYASGNGCTPPPGFQGHEGDLWSCNNGTWSVGTACPGGCMIEQGANTPDQCKPAPPGTGGAGGMSSMGGAGMSGAAGMGATAGAGMSGAAGSAGHGGVAGSAGHSGSTGGAGGALFSGTGGAGNAAGASHAAGTSSTSVVGLNDTSSSSSGGCSLSRAPGRGTPVLLALLGLLGALELRRRRDGSR